MFFWALYQLPLTQEWEREIFKDALTPLPGGSLTNSRAHKFISNIKVYKHRDRLLMLFEGKVTDETHLNNNAPKKKNASLMTLTIHKQTLHGKENRPVCRNKISGMLQNCLVFYMLPCTVQPHNYQLLTYSDGLLFLLEVYQFNIFPCNAEHRVFYNINSISFSILSSKKGGKLIP